ncbi:hypothetical protein LRS74_19980 [Streptomyces sp. LX-29]|uniref:hypothetical protein n=1 Tax=Streptomyces sp. LX-29 TaxID=2900152 RepID=UPI00240E8BCC|nr:hypothetical protein [Streptomyces sp. LX-29]WFB09064.1 hypothetical protein LRS74_19980 [Streptomyces sp. LX-29]
MSARSARRPLLTAAAAGSLLCALWFVPSANANAHASADRDDRPAVSAGRTQVGTQAPSASEDEDLNLADSGSVDVTPYVIGGTAFLGLGVAMVTASMRRPRTEAY